MRICLLTPYHMTPPAPRLLKEKEVLSNISEADIVSPSKEKGIIARNIFLFRELRKNKKKYDLFIVYDLLTLFFISPLILGHKARFMYEVLDSFPHYYSYKIARNSIFAKILSFVLMKFEHCLAKKTVKGIIVNSTALYARFSKKSLDVTLLNYTSPFESLNFVNNPDKKNSFLYIGLFSKDKGADLVLEMSKNYISNQFYIIGDIAYDFDKDNYPNVSVIGRVSFQELGAKIKEIGEDSFIWGISLIKSDNYSYATQEANKDIDYMALGIPIVGNEREATYEKILKGAGVLLDDFEEHLMTPSVRLKHRDTARFIYDKHYNSNVFFKNLIDAIK